MIEVGGLSFTYPGRGQPTLRDLAFEVREREIFGFLGPSGAGKSTLQKVLNRILRRYQGRVRVFGRDLGSHGAEFYEQIGVCFEHPSTYSKLTALENLRFFASLYAGVSEEPMALLDRLGLAADAHRKVAHFSQGMKMRLNLCRALIHRPRLLFLDEPTSGQDPGNARRIKDLLLELRGAGQTLLLTTHDMALAEELCDRVAFLVEGSIRLVDSPRRLRIDHGRRGVRVEYGAGDHTESRLFGLEGIGTNPAFLTLLSKRSVETIHTQEATLEEVFLEVTGRSLR